MKRTALVLGASGGVGSSLCELLLESGWTVVGAGRNAASLAELERKVSVETVELNATDASAVECAAEQAREKHGSLDAMANCVGSLLLKPAHLTSPDDWNGTIATNLGSAFSTVRAAARTMSDGGSVVLVSSAAARVGMANHEAIAAAKAGVIGLTMSAAATYAARGLRVNAVAPGLVDTPMTTRITSNETALAGSTAMHALGRIGAPADVARMMAWLMDPSSSWITGQVFGVDGGLATVRSRRA